MLNFKIIQSEPTTVISLQGRFDSSGSLIVEEQLEKIDSLFPVLDFSEVNFLSSAGIRVLLKTEKALRRKNGKIILSSPSNSIRQILQITGLLEQFTMFDSVDQAVESVLKLKDSTSHQYIKEINNVSYIVKKTGSSSGRVEMHPPENNLSAVSLSEFDFAIGSGGLGSTREETKNSCGKMILTKKFAGVLQSNGESDYLLSMNPSDTFFYINSAINLSGSPDIIISTSRSSTLGELLKNTFSIVSDMSDTPLKAAGFVLAAVLQSGADAGIFSVGVISDAMLGTYPEVINPGESIHLDENLLCNSIGIKIKNTSDLMSSEELNHSVDSLLCSDDSAEVVVPQKELLISSAKLWIFMSEVGEAQESRLNITYEGTLSDEFEVITRRIYNDCSSITLQQLHGGYSAKTFQVFGYDKRGIRILPTVLKLAKSSTIKREAVNYEENVKRYILNNSTAIMGNFFFGNYGGIRYNFVGITGPDSKIGWLTNIYIEKTAEELIPLFDRIFTDILRPWYGQPKLVNFYPYKEHNPTVTFFAELFDKCEEELGISADTERIYIEELGRETVNPYWFLKHQFKEREKKSRLWYKCICHGDLNMQNILLDEVKNIYIIDYSETSFRNAVSDFARLEPIFKFEFPVINEDELKNLIKFEEGLLSVNKLNDIPQFTYPGNDPFVEKSYKMICRLRQYADVVTLFENDLVPYLLAVLEWTFSVVCYQSEDKVTKKYSAISAALICEKILKLEKN